MTNSRWSSYTPLAIEFGACAVYAFPLNADGRELARILSTLMTAVQDRAPRPLLAGDLIDAETHSAEVHLAPGVTSVHVDDALILVRAHACAISKTVAHVSREILAHRLRLGQDGPQQHGVSP